MQSEAAQLYKVPWGQKPCSISLLLTARRVPGRLPPGDHRRQIWHRLEQVCAFCRHGVVVDQYLEISIRRPARTTSVAARRCRSHKC